MTDQTPSTDALVMEPQAAGTMPHPAAHIDPAKANQRVSAPNVQKPKKRRRKPAAARRAASNKAAAAHDSKAAAAKAKAKAALDQSDAARAEGQAAYAAAVAHEVDSFANLPDDAALMLRLADGDAFIDGTISVAPGDIVPAGFGSSYAKDVDVSPDGPPVTVSEAWLVSLAGEAVRCAVGPLSGGGGHHARIPAGHLNF